MSSGGAEETPQPDVEAGLGLRPRLDSRYDLTDDVKNNKRPSMSINVFFSETQRASKCLVWKHNMPQKLDDVITALVAESNGGLMRPNMVLLAKKQLPHNCNEQDGWRNHIVDMGGFMKKIWAENEGEAKQRYEAQVRRCFAGIAAACSQSHCWLITYKRTTARILEAGLKELVNLDPSLAARVVVVCLTSLDQEPFTESPLLKTAWEQSKTLTIKSGTDRDWDKQLSPWSTHIVVLPTKKDITRLSEHLQVCFPSVHLHTVGTLAEPTTEFFSNVVNHAKRGTLVLNFAYMHFNPTYLSALILSSFAAERRREEKLGGEQARLSKDELERLWKLTKEELDRKDCPLRDDGMKFQTMVETTSKFEAFEKCVLDPKDTSCCANYLRDSLRLRFNRESREQAVSLKVGDGLLEELKFVGGQPDGQPGPLVASSTHSGKMETFEAVKKDEVMAHISNGKFSLKGITKSENYLVHNEDGDLVEEINFVMEDGYLKTDGGDDVVVDSANHQITVKNLKLEALATTLKPVKVDFQEPALTLPDTPFEMFVTLDMTRISYKDVVETLMRHMSSRGQTMHYDFLVGSEAAGHEVLSKSWKFHDELLRLATDAKVKGYLLQLLVSLTTLAITALAVIKLDSELKASTLGNPVVNFVTPRIGWLKTFIIVVPVVTTLLISVQSRHNFMLRWAMCQQGAVRLRHAIYSFQTHTGEFENDYEKPLESALKTCEDRKKLAGSVAKIEHELRNGILNEYSWNWDGREDEESWWTRCVDLIVNCCCFSPFYHLRTCSCCGGGPSEKGKLDETTRLIDDSPDRFRKNLTLTGDSFMEAGLNPLLKEYQTSAWQISLGLTILRGFVMLSTAAASLVGLFRYYAWVPLMVAVGAMFQRAIDFQGLPSRLTNINVAIAALRDKKLWWSSLTLSERMMAQNLEVLVKTVELNADAETSAILKAVTSFKSESRFKGLNVQMKPTGTMVI